MSRRVPSSSSVRPSVPSSSSVLSVRPVVSRRRRRRRPRHLSVRRRRRTLSVRPVVRPVVVVRPLSVRPVVRLNITCKTSRSIRW